MPAQSSRLGAALRNAAGFNLVELLVVMTLAGILLGIGIPSYRYFTYSNRASTEVNSLLGDMQLARGEAIKQGQTVTICPGNNNLTACGNSADWSVGWIVFTDFNGNGVIDTANNDTIVRVMQPFGTGDTFVDSAHTTITFISFTRDGISVGTPTDGTDYVPKLHTNPTTPQYTRCLDITQIGAMQTMRTTDPSGKCT
jgi:type IV fimbrial biogenesis protein FimT